MAFASGKHAYGICDITGFRYKLKEMKKTWDGLLVGPDQWSPKHPQLMPRPAPVDPQAIKNARRSSDLKTLDLKNRTTTIVLWFTLMWVLAN